MGAYSYDPAGTSYCTERVNNDEVADGIRRDWHMLASSDGFCGNFGSDIAYDVAAGKFVLLTDKLRARRYSETDPLVSACQSMASAHWLYRIISVFDAPVASLPGRSAYKCVWGVAMRNEIVGVDVAIYDYKGGVSVGARCANSGDYGKLTLKQKRAAVALLNALISPRLTHPYDGVVAGTVA